MVKVKSPKQYDIYLVSLDPTIGSEIKKSRPCVIISPNEMNSNINTVIIAPMTTTSKNYPTRVEISFDGKSGYVVLDQIRTIDKQRLVRKLGETEKNIQKKIKDIINDMLVL